MRVLVVSGLRLFRDSVAESLRALDVVQAVATARSGPHAILTARRVGSNLALLDPATPDARESVTGLRSALPHLRIVGLGIGEAPSEVVSWAELGMVGFVPREASLAEVGEVLVATLRGEASISGRVAAELLRRIAAHHTSGAHTRLPDLLTPREHDVLRLIESGLSNKEIARALDIRLGTVKNHVHNMLTKLGAVRRGHLSAAVGRWNDAAPADRPVTPHDDLGTVVDLVRPAARVVSLVPSLTESVAATRRTALVGATDWCTHPADLDVARVRGTKNPSVQRILDLAPDLVLANREENRELDVRRLRAAGVPVWVTRIETVEEALTSLRRLFVEGLGWGVPDWLIDVEAAWAGPTTPTGERVVVPIWRDPWMAVGSRTFTGDLLARLGYTHVLADHADRYPYLDLADLDRRDIDLVLLPDEPYVFTAEDAAAFSRPTRLVSGRLLTWYGPSLLTLATDGLGRAD